MSRFGTHYQVSKATGVCAHTGETLAPDSPCIAALCERADDEGFDRLDYSVKAWEEGARPAGLFSYWKTIVPSSEGGGKMLVDDEVLLDLFERLGEDERPQRKAFRFVLCLILLRKRKLKIVQRRAARSGKPETWIVSRRGPMEHPPIKLVNPNLSEMDIADLTDQLREILSGDF